ncbi:MAG: hypothetical protein AB7F50_11255 [Fimbriimonadaceae bacterium]
MATGWSRTVLTALAMAFVVSPPYSAQWAERILGYRVNSRMQPGPMPPSEWQPPVSQLDDEYVRAVQALLGTALADPRGGTLSHVEVVVGDAAWRERRAGKGLGWVLPGGRRAVLVDGLEYEVASVIGAANLDEWLQEDHLSTGSYGAYNIVGPTAALPGLLLVHGDVTTAERLYEKTSPHTVGTLASLMLQQVGLRHNMQAADALKRRSDNEAFDSARRLYEVAKFAEASGAFASRYPGDSAPFTVDFARSLVQDTERRVLYPKPGLDLKELQNVPQRQRLQKLAEALDDVKAEQWGQPGGLDWFTDPVMKAWVEEGSSAVPMLLDVIEHDDRFTRSVSFGRNFFPQRTVHTVRTAAWIVLTALWPSAGTVKALPAEERLPTLRARWKAEGHLTEPERWLEVLRDDHAGTSEWRNAGQYLTKPNSQRTMGSLVELAKDPSEAMTGEPLRAKHGAEVTRLLAQRALQSNPADSPARNSSDFFQAADALRIAHSLAKWDPKAALPTLVEITDVALLLLGDSQQGDAGEELVKELCRLVAERAAAGDPTAAKAYRDVLRRLGTRSMFEPEVYRALRISPDNLGMRKVGEDHFDSLRSKLRDGTWTERVWMAGDAARAADSPLLGVQAFRLLLAEAAALDEPLGTAWVEQNSSGPYVKYEYEGGKGGGGMGLPARTKVPDSHSTRVPFSMGDFVAQHVAALPHAPEFLMVAPRLERARARLAVQAWLRDDSQDWKRIVKELAYFHP